MASRFADSLVKAWYQGSVWLYLLWPLSLVYLLVTWARQQCYRTGIFKHYRSPLPVVVVGNITLGGTGKSPMVAYLVRELQSRGYVPGVVSRGYGGSVQSDEYADVMPDSFAAVVGDEPLMLRKQLDCPIVVSSNRRKSIARLEQLGCDIVISDDGLQHYAMARDVELCLFDGERKLGNGMVLPCGPLRESPSRLENVDFFVINGSEWSPEGYNNSYQMTLEPKALVPLNAQSGKPPQAQQKVHAVAAIGNPQRFFSGLKKYNWALESHPFDDHHAFSFQDFDFAQGETIVMTEKDAVKCTDLALENAWYLPVEARLASADGVSLVDAILGLIKQKGYLHG